MKAEEMFCNLGFDIPIEKDHAIQYEHMVDCYNVIFYKYEKSVCAYDSVNNDAINVTMDLFKAIQKQLIELGWI